MSAAPASRQRSAPAAGRLGVLVFGALVLASFAAFFLAQRLKHIPTAVQQLKLDPAFYPEGGGVPRSEAVSFEIERRDLVTVRIIDSAGATVATLAAAHPLAAYAPYTVEWNGRRGAAAAGGQPAGAPAPKGEYRVVITLARRKLEVRSPTELRLFRSRG